VNGRLVVPKVFLSTMAAIAIDEKKLIRIVNDSVKKLVWDGTLKGTIIKKLRGHHLLNQSSDGRRNAVWTA